MKRQSHTQNGGGMSNRQLESTLQKMAYKTPNPLDDNFYQTLEQHLDSPLVTPSFYQKYQTLILATAALFLFGFGIMLGRIIETSKTNTAFTSTVTLKSHEPVTIYLVYNSDKAREDISFRIALDSALHFVTDNTDLEHKKEIAWSGTLKKGRNEIPIVIAGTKIGEWNFVAQARIDGIITENRVKVRING